ncbi:F0F1 ATP synthase subunit epsilon [Parvularcula flava]|uniref:ATP synthase epsilon chain n=1 Tax=Aquisalinus luteolus TaxID=1566827 RepID=A0A8J3A2P0_9PROT|nr:F0F1 ATP synthase subunit epsilon [Aquisalinus luteolus]NHK28444.1 F0F1 ATP synthase subunit epsilon [Aquisalinus luteolus]GGH98495.1 hypothetical protein GCM10011355_22220 [Aquisalinus luteolus]
MADKLTFNLVSPEKEVYSGEVDQVIVPGTEGEFGVLPNHAPFMSTLLPGMLVIKNGGEERRIFVQGGFADVTPAGLTVLAELAIPAEELKGEVLSAQKAAANDQLQKADTPEASLAARRAVDTLAAH